MFTSPAVLDDIDGDGDEDEEVIDTANESAAHATHTASSSSAISSLTSADIESFVSLRDVTAVQCIAETMYTCMDMLIQVTADGPIYATYIIDILDCVDRLCLCAANTMPHIPSEMLVSPTQYQAAAAAAVLGTSSTSPIPESTFKVFLTVFARCVDRLFAFEAMISSHSRATATASESEPLPQQTAENPLQGLITSSGDDITTNALLRCIHDATQSALTCLDVLFRLAPISSMQSSVLDAQDSMLMQITALALCKGVMHNQREVAVTSIQTVATLATKDSEAEVTVHAAKTIISCKLNALLSNSLLRKTEIIALELDNICGIIQMGRDIEKHIQLLSQSLAVVESCCMAFIDLHTSDDLELLSVYKRLQAEQKLSLVFQLLDKIHKQILSTSRAKKIISKRDRNKSEEAAENVLRFLEYKSASNGNGTA